MTKEEAASWRRWEERVVDMNRGVVNIVMDIRGARRRGATGDIPWLEGLMRAAPRAAIIQPFGGREEEIASAEATECVLRAGEAIKASEQPRNREGLRTRA